MNQEVSRHFLGSRVRSARDSAGLTQDEVASQLGFSDRQTVSDIETGRRMLKAEELLRLCELTGRDSDYFLDPLNVTGEAEFCWRLNRQSPANPLSDFEEQSGKWVGLLRWLKDQREGQRKSALKYALRISERSSFEHATALGEQFVEDLKLGNFPAQCLSERLETDLDISVLYVDVAEGHNISGATCHLPDCTTILINRHENLGRRNYDLAHETFHALSWDSLRPAHIEFSATDARVKRIERLADNFAASVLMPKLSLDIAFDSARASDLSYLRDVAARYGVTCEALGWRLLSLELIAERMRIALLNSGKLYGDASTPAVFSRQFAELLIGALDRGLIAVRRAAKVIGVSTSGLKDIFLQHKLVAQVV